MTSLQKVIKYIAIAFATFLSVSIIGGILMALSNISFLLSGSKGDAGDMKTYSVDSGVSSLSLELSGAELQIKTAEEFSVESNNKYIEVESDNGELRIYETKKLFSYSPKGLTVILNIPEGFVFDDAEIETGAGKVEIDGLSADTLDISFGAGEADIRNLVANSSANIDGGAGELSIDGGLLRNLELDMGVGELTLESRLEGKSCLDYGVGETNLVLRGNREDYKIEIDKGVGEALLEGENMKDDSVYGAGTNEIDIDGGIGAISIEFRSL